MQFSVLVFSFFFLFYRKFSLFWSCHFCCNCCCGQCLWQYCPCWFLQLYIYRLLVHIVVIWLICAAMTFSISTFIWKIRRKKKHSHKTHTDSSNMMTVTQHHSNVTTRRENGDVKKPPSTLMSFIQTRMIKSIHENTSIEHTLFVIIQKIPLISRI